MDVIVVDADPLSRTTIKSYLSGQGVRVAADADNLSSGLHLIRGARPDILILELPPSPDATLEAVRRLRTDYPGLGIILSAKEMSSQLILRSIRAGAQEFLARPLDIRELSDAVNRLGTFAHRGNGAGRKDGKVIAVHSSKGGVGVTSVAINLAAKLSQATERRTAILDLNFQRDDVEVMLDLRPPRSLAEILGDGPLDEDILGSALTSYDAHLSILSGTDLPDQPGSIPAVGLVETFGLLKQMFDYVVVDAGCTLDPRTFEVFNLCDLILVVAILDVLTVRNVRRGLGLFHKLDSNKEKIRLLVNRHDKKTRVSVADLEETTGAEVFWQIPNDYRTMSTAVDAGIPAVIHAPRSKVARSFEGLATEVLDLWVPAEPETAAETS